MAVGHHKRYVKIVTYDGREFLFDSIYHKNDALYGLLRKSTKKNILEIELHEDQIKEVYIYVLNKEKSRKRTVILIAVPGIIIVVFGLMFLIISLSTWEPWF